MEEEDYDESYQEDYEDPYSGDEEESDDGRNGNTPNIENRNASHKKVDEVNESERGLISTTNTGTTVWSRGGAPLLRRSIPKEENLWW